MTFPITKNSKIPIPAGQVVNLQKSSKGGGSRLEPVRFEFTHPTANTVCVAGTFNNWQPEAAPMIRRGDGGWLKELVLAPGSYEYCLVVNGEWITDPLGKDSVANPFGGKNSVLKVG